MKISRVQMTAAAVMAAMLLGGCGDAPYELTESEENIIVDYSAHVVAKYNTHQKEGIVWVEPDTEEPEEREAPAQETDSAESDGQTSGGEGALDGTEEPVLTATLNDLFGVQGLQISYAGSRLTESYVQDDYYALNAYFGKTYLVVAIDIANVGEADAAVDNLALSPKFKAAVNDEKEVAAEMTFLLEDFSTFQDTVSAGTTRQTVILFQIPDSVTQVDSLSLNVTVHGENYQIIL